MTTEELSAYLMPLKTIDKNITEDNIIAYVKAIEFMNLSKDELRELLEHVIQHENYITPNKILLSTFKVLERFRDIEKKFNILLNMAILSSNMPNKIVSYIKTIIENVGGWNKFVYISKTKNTSEYNALLVDFTKLYISK